MLPPISALLMVALIVSIVHTEDDRARVATSDPGARTEDGPSYAWIANSIDAVANERTVEFLKWAKTKHPLYANVELDDLGDIIRLDVEVCYNVKDDELKVIAKLPQLNELVFYSADVTDAGIKYLDVTKSLKTLIISGASRQRVTTHGIQRLEKANPTLAIQLKHMTDIAPR